MRRKKRTISTKRSYHVLGRNRKWMVSVKRGRIICGIFGVISLLVFLITLFLINPDTPGSKLIFASSLGGGLVGILTGAGVKTEYSTVIGVSISTMLFLQLWGTFQIWTIPALIVFSILLIVSVRNS
jgi:hypothetical protein